MVRFISRLKSGKGEQLLICKDGSILISTNPIEKELEYQKYLFDKIVPNTVSQSTFYAENVRSNVRQLLKGKNSTVLFFGVADSGKTYSFIGKSGSNNDNLGVIQRCCLDILLNLNSKNVKGTKGLFIKLLGFCDDSIIDLLARHLNKKNISLRVVEDGDKGMIVVGALSYQVESVDGILKILDALPFHSYDIDNRHIVCTLEVKSLDKSGEVIKNIRSCKMNIVKLANWEILDPYPSSPSSGTRMMLSKKHKDFGAILSVMLALRKHENGILYKETNTSYSPNKFSLNLSSSPQPSKHSGYIPFRYSRLSYFLKDTMVLNNNSNGETMMTIEDLSVSSTVLFIHTIHSTTNNSEDFSKKHYQTLSSLKYISRIRSFVHFLGSGDDDLEGTYNKKDYYDDANIISPGGSIYNVNTPESDINQTPNTLLVNAINTTTASSTSQYSLSLNESLLTGPENMEEVVEGETLLRYCEILCCLNCTLLLLLYFFFLKKKKIKIKKKQFL
jgi:hypothetical protein